MWSLAASVILVLCTCAVMAVKRGDGMGGEAVTVQHLAQVVSSLQAKVQAQQQEIDALKGQNQKMAAFSAHIRLDRVPARHYDVIPFAASDANWFGVFDTVNFTFTAPHAGYYFFIITVDVSPDYEAVSVTKNGQTVITADKDDRVSTHLTGSTVIHLKAGDELQAIQEGITGYIDGGPDSTFSGFLIHADE